MYASRGITPPDQFSGMVGNDYMQGNVGFGSRGAMVPLEHMQLLAERREAPKQHRQITARRNSGLARFPDIDPELLGRLPSHVQDMVMNYGAPRKLPSSAGFQTSWGTTQGDPVQNAGGGQSMFGAPNLPQHTPPIYAPPPGPSTGGYQPTMPQMPGATPPGMPHQPSVPQAPPEWLMAAMQVSNPNPYSYSRIPGGGIRVSANR